jgi:hypothetical protein
LDDDLGIRKLEIQINEIRNKNVDLVFSDSYVFSTQHQADSNKRMHTINRFLMKHYGCFFSRNRIPNLTVLAKKEKLLL